MHTDAVRRAEEWRPAAAAADTGEVCLWLFLLRCCGFSHTAALCAQHMSNTSQHTCRCITIWLLNPHQSFLEALCSLSLTSCLRSTFFFLASLTLHCSFFDCIPVIAILFMPSLSFFLPPHYILLCQHDVCKDTALGTHWVKPDLGCRIRRWLMPRRSPHASLLRSS